MGQRSVDLIGGFGLTGSSTMWGPASWRYVPVFLASICSEAIASSKPSRKGARLSVKMSYNSIVEEDLKRTMN